MAVLGQPSAAADYDQNQAIHIDQKHSSDDDDGGGSDGHRCPTLISKLDSLDREANLVPGVHGSLDIDHPPAKALSTADILKLAFQSIGVIYGDVGTSPLYVYSSTFPDSTPDREDVLGALSLIIYSLTLIPLIKYVFIVLKANDNGNGGTFALYSLICRHAKVSSLQNGQVEDEGLSGYKLRIPNRDSTRGASIKEYLERSKCAKTLLLIITLLGTSAVLGDGVLTPAISVLSAVGGIQTQNPSLKKDAVVSISIVVLIMLFSLQRFGTHRVGFLFAPCVLTWFAFIGLIGVYNIAKHDATILRAFNPYYIIKYFQKNHEKGWISLGGIVLAITGTEAMFADLGHFSVPSVRIAFTTTVYPALLAAYIGQGSYLLKYPGNVSNSFYKSIPGPIFWPMFVVAVGAAIIASQAMISATFSIVEQSLALGCFPRVKIVHTSSKLMGQVYIPEMNWILMILCVIVVATFQDTTYIGNAYGIAVVAVMLVTTTLVTLIMLMIWQTKIYLVAAFLAVFMPVELLLFSANLYKFSEGGWVPVVFSGFLLMVMAVWQHVTAEKYKYEADKKVSIASLVSRLESDLGFNRVPGIGMMYAQLVQGVPPIFDHFVDNMSALHSVIVFVSVKHLPVATIAAEERFLVRRVGAKSYRMYRSVIRYGYMDGPIDHQDFETLLLGSLENFLRTEVECITVEMEENTGEVVEVEDNAMVNNNNLIERKEEMETEIAFLRRAREVGVTYLLGNSKVEAAENSGFWKRFVVNVLYDCLQRVARRSRVSLRIPHKRLMEVGITYQI